jgi:hypothetical protein
LEYDRILERLVAVLEALDICRWALEAALLEDPAAAVANVANIQRILREEMVSLRQAMHVVIPDPELDGHWRSS